MALIDERGRLLGVVNVIDAGVAALVLAILAAMGVGYAVFKVPAAPEVQEVVPASQQVGPPETELRLLVRGRNLLPYARVYVQRTGDSAKAVRAAHASPKIPIDRYALVTTSTAKFFVESPSSAEVWLPANLGPGTYDLVFYNETQVVGVKEGAFTLTPLPPGPPPPPPPPGPPPLRATLRVVGAFTRLSAPDTRAVATGLRLVSSVEGETAEVLSVAPAEPDVQRITSDAIAVAKIENKLQVPATVRVRCTISGTDCQIGGMTVGRNTTVTLIAGQRRYQFYVQELAIDAPDPPIRGTTVIVRFVTRAEVVPLVAKGDADNRAVQPRDRSREPAAIIAIGKPQAVAADTQLYPGGEQAFTVKEQMVAFEATLRVPLSQVADAWLYKGQTIKAGGSLLFETPRYTVRGWILSVSFDGADGRALAR